MSEPHTAPNHRTGAAEPFGPPSLPDAYACGALGARHAAHEAMALAAHRVRTNGGKGSLAARRALALADVAVHEAITRLIEGGER
ncbi:hypothetical protein [Parvularcula oceani]|uniref:hypothetical protein n=1 Tax=Parvularcula oceani TaxID=1247963 RepID=UPI0012DC47DD|nr:hypothetical protein [Parvularcula oceani]